ncbi:hypothetical protein BsWGS_13124 [Bradybaena similaris]
MNALRTSIIMFTFYTVHSASDVIELDILMEKRDVSITAVPNCQYSWTYQLLNNSRSITNATVRIAQNIRHQLFQVFHCIQQGSAGCGGMDRTRYDTQCRVTESLTLALICDSPHDCVTKNRLEFIYVASGCACYIREKTVMTG